MPYFVTAKTFHADSTIKDNHHCKFHFLVWKKKIGETQKAVDPILSGIKGDCFSTMHKNF